MQDRFTVFIDESGEAGIQKIRSNSTGGASPYMTLGASLINNRSRATVEKTLDRITKNVGKDPLHCSQLRHDQLVYFAREIVKLRMRFFGVISRKVTLGNYRETIEGSPKKYYNKCAQLLLERIGWFMEARSIPPENLDIIFEEANVDYGAMRNLIRKCQSNPKHKNSAWLSHISADNIQSKKKIEEPLLKIADLIAHALYKCVDKQAKNFNIPEPRYLVELAPRFFGHPDSNAVVGAGLHCVHTVEQLELDEDVRKILEGLVATPPN